MIVDYIVEHKSLFLKSSAALFLNIAPVMLELNDILESISLFLGAVLSMFLIVKTFIDIKTKIKKK